MAASLFAYETIVSSEEATMTFLKENGIIRQVPPLQMYLARLHSQHELGH